MPSDSPKQKTPPSVTLKMDIETARAVWHAIGTSVELMDAVEVPPHAPLFGQRDRLVAAARRLDHEINHAPTGASDA